MIQIDFCIWERGLANEKDAYVLKTNHKMKQAALQTVEAGESFSLTIVCNHPLRNSLFKWWIICNTYFGNISVIAIIEEYQWPKSKFSGKIKGIWTVGLQQRGHSSWKWQKKEPLETGAARGVTSRMPHLEMSEWAVIPSLYHQLTVDGCVKEGGSLGHLLSTQIVAKVIINHIVFGKVYELPMVGNEYRTYLSSFSTTLWVIANHHLQIVSDADSGIFLLCAYIFYMNFLIV